MGLEPIRRYRHTPLKRARIPIPPPRLGGFSIASVSSAEDQVQYEIQDGVAYVTMNRPQARNALTFAMYERIEALCEGPYLEMFARSPRPGWDRWGLEADSPEIAARRWRADSCPDAPHAAD